MKTIIHIPYLVIALIFLVGCGESSEKTDNPKSYNKAGIGFKYPRNWKVTEDTQESGRRFLIVEAPGSAIVLIEIYSADDALEIQDYAQALSRSAQEESSVANFNASTFSGVVKSDGYEILAEQYSVTFLETNVPHTRTYRRKPIDNKVYFLMEQVADEDRSQATKGFKQISSSFRYGLPSPQLPGS